MAVRVPHTEHGNVVSNGTSIDTSVEPDEATLLSSPPPDDVAFSHQVIHHPFPDHLLDIDANKVVNRLTRFGYEAYLVGGCVRDLLFGQRPKDFDVATSALPAEIKRVFRNCRLIGRRFRLAHLFFRNQKIIEVATFRRGATSDDDVSSRHAAENLFGGPADDAIRRDFPINALMYDVGRGEIHDYVGGLQDVESKVLNTIGDPNRRFPEDPVRIIRAIKFSVRLDLKIDPDVQEAIGVHAPLILECAPARLVEEMYKILRSGRSAECLRALDQYGVLVTLMPELARRIEGAPPNQRMWDYLEKLDARVRGGAKVSDTLLLSALVYPHCRRAFKQKGGDLSLRIHDRIAELFAPMTFPKRILATVRQILVAQRRLMSGPGTKRARRIMERDYAFDAVEFMGLVAEDAGAEKLHAEWRRLLPRRPKGKSGTRGRSGAPRRRRRRRRSREDGPRQERPKPPE